MTYDEIEDAMLRTESKSFKDYQKIRSQNIHKMEPIPICMIDEKLNQLSGFSLFSHELSFSISSEISSSTLIFMSLITNTVYLFTIHSQENFSILLQSHMLNHIVLNHYNSSLELLNLLLN